VLDELPSLELAATAVALVLLLRAFVLFGRGSGLLRGRERVESARARDLIGLAILVGAVAYAWGAQRASTWFVIASVVAIAAQLLGFYLRAAGQLPQSRQPNVADGSPTDLELGEEDLDICPSCGHGALVELLDSERYLAGLTQLTRVAAAVCPNCGALTGQVEDPASIPVGPEHGTALRQSPHSSEQEALEEPAEHDG
jgi:hypothetical protein